MQKQEDICNPCYRKILFPFLKRCQQKSSRTTSQHRNFNCDEDARTFSQRKKRLSTVQNERDPQNNEENFKSQQKQIQFLQKCFEEIVMQNSCLLQHILFKQQQLYSVKEELQEKKKIIQNQLEKRNKNVFHFGRRVMSKNLQSQFSNNIEGREVLFSMNSEDECSLAANIRKNRFSDFKTEQNSDEKNQENSKENSKNQINIKHYHKKISSQKKQKSSVEKLQQYESDKRIQCDNSINLQQLKQKLNEINFSKLDKLRMRKGLVTKRQEQKGQNVDLCE